MSSNPNASERALFHHGGSKHDRTAHCSFCLVIVAMVAQVKHLAIDVCPLLVFVNPKSGGLKGRELLHSFRKLLNPHQVFDITNGGPLAG